MTEHVVTPHAIETVGLSVTLGGIRALKDVSLRLPASTIAGLIGPNGAGKSTLLNAICGLVPVVAGDVLVFGEPAGAYKPYQKAERGIGRSFQGVQFVPELTALENVLLGAHTKLRSGLFRSMLKPGSTRTEEREWGDRARSALARVGMGDVGNVRMSELPFGVQKRVDIARAIVREPRVLLLDEPMAGLSVDEKTEMIDVIGGLGGDGDLSIVIVEHDMRVVNQLCSHVVVLDAGSLLAEGLPGEVLRRPEVIEAYVGAGGDSDTAEVEG